MPRIDRDGVRIHFKLHGAPVEGRPAVLLTHGFSASSAMWAPNVPALAADRTVVTWDLRGHGRSDAPEDPSLYSHELAVADMAAVLDAAGIGRAVLGGMSLGGYLSLAFHVRDPERVAALVLVDTGPGYRRDGERDGWNELVDRTAADLEARGLAALGSSPEQDTGADPLALARAARGIMAQHDAAVIESLPSVSVPTLVVVGAQDAPFLRAAGYMATTIPGARQVVIEQAGHAPNLDRPEVFNPAVGDFLEEL